jgi:uncharacterized protein
MQSAGLSLTLIIAAFAGASGAAEPGADAGPSFGCAQAVAGSIEALICADGQLSELARTLAEVYAAASAKSDENSAALRAGQRGWLKRRAACWNGDDRRDCVEQAYVERIAELQARYALVPGKGPVTYVCDGDSASLVIATYFATDPPTLLAKRGGGESLMYLQRSGSGAMYQSRNETLWEHHGAALITWGHEAPQMHCVKRGTTGPTLPSR